MNVTKTIGKAWHGVARGFVTRLKRPTPPVSDDNHLKQIIVAVQRLLSDTFDKLDAAHERGLRSKTPPTKPHPLMVAVYDIRTAIATFATPTPTVDDRPLMELVTLLDTLERWKGHPFHPKMVQGLVNEYQHTAIMLAAATALVDVGNGVMFQESASHRTPDLLVIISVITPCRTRSPRCAAHGASPGRGGRTNGIASRPRLPAHLYQASAGRSTRTRAQA